MNSEIIAGIPQVQIRKLQKCCKEYNCKSSTPPIKRGRGLRPPPPPWNGKICKNCGAFCPNCEWSKLIQVSGRFGQ